MASYIDASEASLDFAYDYPTPSASSNAEEVESVKEQPPKKKRKQWGQRVPEIVPILPPRKRAKTAEEKEQRKNERILRNRRAADKSRQRQKAAQAELEQLNKTLIAENAQLKELLETHGLLDGFHFTAPPSAPSIDFSISEDNDTPIFSNPTPSISEHDQEQSSPCIAPQLDLNTVSNTSTSVQTGLTQYPAVSANLGPEASTLGTEFLSQYSLDSHTLPDNCDDLFNFNPLANSPTVPDFGIGIGNDFFTAGNDCPEQLSAAAYFDFNAFDTDATCSFPPETSQSTSVLQPEFSASFDDGRRQGVATETH